MKPLRPLAALSLTSVLLSCGTLPNPSASDPTRPLSEDRGRLRLELTGTAAPGNSGAANGGPKANRPQAVLVTVVRATAHSSQVGWVDLFQGSVEVDLLKLSESTQLLGMADLPPGKITQVRLYTAEEGPHRVVLPNGEEIPLKVPSGVQSGIKVKGPFELERCAQTTVPLVFDGQKSIHVHPTGPAELWILRPVIRTGGVANAPHPCAPATPGATPPSEGEPTGGIVEGPGGPGTFVPRPAGDPCELGAQCLSGVCAAQLCAPGLPGAACSSAQDCGSGQCNASEGVCAPPTNAGGAGAPCSANAQCLSGSCEAGRCDGGAQGAPCAQSSDCALGFVCDLAVCVPQIN